VLLSTALDTAEPRAMLLSKRLQDSILSAHLKKQGMLLRRPQSTAELIFLYFHIIGKEELPDGLQS
jgi:hypothetical protein